MQPERSIRQQSTQVTAVGRTKWLRLHDSFHETPLHLAAANASPECATLLLEVWCPPSQSQAGVVEVDRANLEGNSPLHIACRKGERVAGLLGSCSSGVEETLYLLLLVATKNKKNVNIQNNKGKVGSDGSPAPRRVPSSTPGPRRWCCCYRFCPTRPSLTEKATPCLSAAPGRASANPVEV
jgi:hypothetical protein